MINANYNINSNKKIIGKNINPSGWWDIEVVPINRQISGGSTSTVTNKDLSFTRYTNAQIATDLQINEIFYGETTPALNYSVPPGNQFIQDGNIFKPQTDGATKTITISSSIPNRTVEVKLVGKIQQEPFTDIFDDYVSTSLAKHCSDAVDNRLTGKAWNIYTTQNHATSVYTRNTDFWAADLVSRLTCISPWNSQSGDALGITLITPKHFICCGHGGNYNLGTTVRFIKADNTVIERTVTGSKIHPQYNIDTADITICRLNADVPNDVIPAKLLPANISNYLPNLNFTYRIPALCLDAEEKGLVLDLYDLGKSGNLRQALYKLSTKSPRNNFTQQIVGGDSGNPQFLIINNELALVGVWSTTSFAAGAASTDLSKQLSAINQLIADVDAMAGISTGYTVQTVDLSGFPTY